MKRHVLLRAVSTLVFRCFRCFRLSPTSSESNGESLSRFTLSRFKRSRLIDEYDHLAPAYNRYFGKQACSQLAPVVIPILRCFASPTARILDLCCGCGHLTEAISAVGYLVVGVDASGEMLRFERENAPAVTFLKQDARNADFINDATLCAFNSIANFKSKELNCLFANVAEHLSPTGIFVFDTYSEESYSDGWNGHYTVWIDDTIVTVRARYRSSENVVDNLITLWHPTSVVKVCIAMHPHARDLLCAELRSVGFSSVEVCDMEKDLGISHQNGHLVFVASKQRSSPEWLNKARYAESFSLRG